MKKKTKKKVSKPKKKTKEKETKETPIVDTRPIFYMEEEDDDIDFEDPEIYDDEDW